MSKAVTTVWPSPTVATDLQAFFTATGITPVMRDRFIALGDKNAAEARVYFMPVDVEIMKQCAADTNLFTAVPYTDKFSSSYLKFIVKQFNMLDNTVVKMDNKMIPVKEIVEEIQKLSHRWKVKHLLFIKNKPGFCIFFAEENVLLQFAQPIVRVPSKTLIPTV